MVHILDALTRLETKFDNLAVGQSSVSSIPDMTTKSSATYPSSRSSGRPAARSDATFSQKTTATDLPHSNDLLTVPHKVILWPSIYIHLINSGNHTASDLQYILQEGTPWFIRLELAKHPKSLPYDPGLQSVRIDTPPSNDGYSARWAFPRPPQQAAAGVLF